MNRKAAFIKEEMDGPSIKVRLQCFIKHWKIADIGSNYSEKFQQKSGRVLWIILLDFLGLQTSINSIVLRAVNGLYLFILWYV